MDNEYVNGVDLTTDGNVVLNWDINGKKRGANKGIFAQGVNFNAKGQVGAYSDGNIYVQGTKDRIHEVFNSHTVKRFGGVKYGSKHDYVNSKIERYRHTQLYGEAGITLDSEGKPRVEGADVQSYGNVLLRGKQGVEILRMMKKIIFLIVISQILIIYIFFYKSMNFNKNTNTEEWKNLELYWKEKDQEEEAPTKERQEGSNIILNDEDVTELVLYFRNDMGSINSTIGSSISKNKKNAIKFFSRLDEYYSFLSPDKVNQVKESEFLYGKITKIYLGCYQLELFELDLNHKINRKVEYKFYYKDEEIEKILEDINNSKLEGYYNLGGNDSVISIITKNKKIYKSLKMLTTEEKQLYNIMMKLFEKDIPKKYFETRDAKLHP